MHCVIELTFHKIDAVDKPKILATMMGDMIEENGGSVSAEEIISYIQQNWHTRKLSDGTSVTNADLDFCVRTTLNTNPRFMVSTSLSTVSTLYTHQ